MKIKNVNFVNYVDVVNNVDVVFFEFFFYSYDVTSVRLA